MEGSGRRTWGRGLGVAIVASARAEIVFLEILFALLGVIQVRAADTVLASVQARVGAVRALSASPDGSYLEKTGNCLLWTVGDGTYTIADLHTLMTGEKGASDRVADQIVVQVGKASSRAMLVWPPPGRRDVHKVDMAILELEQGTVGQPFGPEVFPHRDGGLPKELYLAAPGHRAGILQIKAPAVAYGSQWFIYRELSHGDSGGMVFALEGGEIVPHGFVSSIGALPGEATRGTAMYGRDAMRTFVNQFLEAQAGRRLASRP